jgi:hypothetical protein
MPSISSRARPWAALALGFALSGCSEPRDDFPREPVSGRVTFDGEPIARGAILFKASGGTSTAMDAGGLIRDGEYRLAKAEGPVPGSYRVLITEEGERPQDVGGQFSLRPKGKPSRIPAAYNTNTTLVAEVKKGQPNTFNFDLKKADGKETASRAQRR